MMRRISAWVLVALLFTVSASAQTGTGVLRNVTISAAEQAVTLNLAGVESVGISVTNSGTYTLAFEASMDGGRTYSSVGTVDNSDYTNDTGTTGPGNWSFANLGWSHFRVRASAYTDGTPVVRLVRGYGGVTAPLSAGAVSGSNSAAGATGSAVPASASYTGINIGGTHRGWTGFSVGSQFAAGVAIVDGSGNQITSFGGGTQFAEDAVHTSGATGTLSLGVRSDTATSLAGTTGDYTAPIFNNVGRLWATAVIDTALPAGTNNIGDVDVLTLPALPAGTNNIGDVDVVSSALPTGASTSANQSTAITALQLIDNPVGSSTGGTAGTSSFMAGGIHNTSAPTLTNGQQASLQLSSTGALIVTGAAGTTQYAEDAAHTSGDQVVALGAVRRDTTPSSSSGTAGDYSTINVDQNGRVYTQAVLYNSSGTELTLANDVVEDAAETAGGSGPMVLSVRRDTAASSAGASGDNATFNTDSLGRLWTRPGNPCQDHARIQTAAISNSTSGNVEVVGLNGSDLIYVCGYSLIAGAATSVRFVYGTGTACATGETGLTGAWSFAANGGITQANGGAPQFVVPAGNAFCTENTGANAIAGHVTYVRTAAP